MATNPCPSDDIAKYNGPLNEKTFIFAYEKAKGPISCVVTMQIYHAAD